MIYRNLNPRGFFVFSPLCLSFSIYPFHPLSSLLSVSSRGFLYRRLYTHVRAKTTGVSIYLFSISGAGLPARARR